jgi:hypothetical protein
MPRKKRGVGAPPGNQNARKHGFYSKILTPEQKQVLDIAARLDIDSEVALLRMQIRSILQTNPQNLDPIRRTMSQLCSVVRIRHDMASRKRRELISMARLGLPVDGLIKGIVPRSFSVGGSPVDGMQLGVKQFESKIPISKLIDTPVEVPSEQQNNP